MSGKRIWQVAEIVVYLNELAYKARLNVRSIQRIESGEVTPRLSSLNILSEILHADFNSEEVKAASLWLMLMHLSSLIPLIIVPLIIWVWKKDEFPEIDTQGIDVLNFQISMCLYLFAGSMLIFVIVGLLILPLLGLFISFVTLRNTIKVAMDQEYYYPLTIHFVKND